MANPNIKAVITAEDNASKTLKKVGSGVNKLGAAAAKAAKVGLLALGGAAAYAVKEFNDSQKVAAQLNAVLKSTNGVAGVTAKQVTKLGAALQKTTTFSDEEVVSAENLLLTFTKIGKDIFPKATKTVLDMSVALGQDTKASAIQLGKALQDPILGITALRRVGVNFSDKQKDVIKGLVETGQSAKAQKLILKELQVEFGGSAEAAGKTFGGQLKILNNTLSEVAESIGAVLVGALTPLAAKLSEFVQTDQFQKWLKQVTNWLKVNLPIAINYVTNTLIPSLINIFNALWPTIKTVLTWLGNLIVYISNHKWIVIALTTAFVALKVAMAISKAVAAFNAGLAAARAGMALTKVSVAALKGSLVGLKTFLVGFGGWAAFAAAAVVAFILIRQEAKKTIDQIKRMNSSIDSLQDSRSQVLKRLQGEKDPKKQKQLRKILISSDPDNQFRSGGMVRARSGVLTRVGEEGAENVILPGGSRVQRNIDTKLGGGSTVNNFNFNVGMYFGTAVERRKAAEQIWKDLTDIASARGTTPSKMLGM